MLRHVRLEELVVMWRYACASIATARSFFVLGSGDAGMQHGLQVDCAPLRTKHIVRLRA